MVTHWTSYWPVWVIDIYFFSFFFDDDYINNIARYKNKAGMLWMNEWMNESDQIENFFSVSCSGGGHTLVEKEHQQQRTLKFLLDQWMNEWMDRDRSFFLVSAGMFMFDHWIPRLTERECCFLFLCVSVVGLRIHDVNKTKTLNEYNLFSGFFLVQFNVWCSSFARRCFWS